MGKAQVADNRRLYERTVAHDGCYYPIGSVPMAKADWRRQFDDQWEAFAAAKQQYDPLYLLTPGQAIFA